MAARTGPTTRERLVRTAHDLFYAEGFSAIGLDRILAEVGVTKTTFYNHFESKDDLVQATLEMHDAWWRDVFSELHRRHGGDDPRNRLLLHQCRRALPRSARSGPPGRGGA